MRVGIRRARASDIATLDALAQRAVAEIGRAFYSRRQIVRAVNRMASVDSRLIADGSLYVAELGDTIVGCIGWTPGGSLLPARAGLVEEDLTAEPGSAVLRSLFVEPAHAGRGVARSLFRRCKSDAAKAGFRRMEALASAAAKGPCRRFGFARSRAVRLRFDDGLELVSYHMTLDL